METISEKLNRIKTAKENIKTSLENKGLTVDDNIETYASKIDEIQSANFETISICDYLFYRRGNLIDALLPSCNNITSASYMFHNANYNGYLNLEGKSFVNLQTANYMFDGCYATKINIKGVDFSKVPSMAYFLNNNPNLTELISDDIINCSLATTFSNAFYNCQKLTKLATIDCSYANSFGTYTFYNMQSLVDFGGLKDVGKAYQTSRAENYSSYTITLTDCYSLSHDSLMNIINNLYDIKTLGCKPQRLRLSSTRLALLSEEEIAIATNKGWNVTT